MEILHQKKARFVNDETTRKNPDSGSVIYITTSKVAQCRLVAENRREKEEAKKVTSKKISTIKVYLQLKRYGTFDRCINSIKILSLSTNNEERLIQIIHKSSNTI